MIDVGEVAKLRRGQLVLAVQEPHPAGPGAQPGEAGRHQRSVTRPHLPYQHRRSVAQYQPLTRRSRSWPGSGRTPTAGPQPVGEPPQRPSRGTGRGNPLAVHVDEVGHGRVLPVRGEQDSSLYPRRLQYIGKDPPFSVAGTYGESRMRDADAHLGSKFTEAKNACDATRGRWPGPPLGELAVLDRVRDSR